MLALLLIASAVLIYTALSPIHSRTSPMKDDGEDVIDKFKRACPTSTKGPFIYFVVLVLYRHFMPFEPLSLTGIQGTVKKLRGADIQGT